ncbi:aldo/keto reductase [Anianabacter salinae]|uniref:aldo/keto reductase n=1 Tax=Anianabacter salinae TaxID=2851023 RepID=UPI00225DF3D0|nr:aldo/keto reductase [Anianabacter salinae]MBV0911404.1 aldo/keto reductase [Anianabacter salinae]
MKMNRLGRTDVMVSELCLGSMTWGTQNTEAEGHAQIDRALDRGVNFIDTAEMYPTNPVSAETVGDTESIIGTWLARTGRRGDIVLATKVSGTNGGFVREGRGYDGATIRQTVDQSLERLRTDHIDLYQLHWPNRGSYHFRQSWTYDPSGQDRAETEAHMLDVLRAMDDLVKAGKVRHFGLSNETTWGTMMWLRLAEEHGLPRVVSVQNEYSLLARLADTDMAEMCVNEDVGLLPFSPMAVGLLSGKYAPDVTPEGTRRSLTPDLGGRITPRVWPAIDAYRAVAARHGLDANQMALAFTLTRPFVVSSIFGATSMEQLDLALGAADLTLSDEVLADIAEAHKTHPMPF